MQEIARAPKTASALPKTRLRLGAGRLVAMLDTQSQRPLGGAASRRSRNEETDPREHGLLTVVPGGHRVAPGEVTVCVSGREGDRDDHGAGPG